MNRKSTMKIRITGRYKREKKKRTFLKTWKVFLRCNNGNNKIKTGRVRNHVKKFSNKHCCKIVWIYIVYRNLKMWPSSYFSVRLHLLVLSLVGKI